MSWQYTNSCIYYTDKISAKTIMNITKHIQDNKPSQQHNYCISHKNQVKIFKQQSLKVTIKMQNTIYANEAL